MAANTLSKEKRNEILEMLAARETYADIAKKVECSIANIDYYAKRYGKKIKALQEEYDARHMNRGLRTREKRIELLERLAALHVEELEEKGLHYTDKKVTPQGDVVEVEVYNSGLINQIRGISKDLAEETTGRFLRIAPTNPDGETPYDGGSALNKLEGALNRLASRMEQGSQEPDGDGS